MLPVAIVLVNWRGWADTVECLESVYRLNPLPAAVIVCDNDSKDDSVERIDAWARGTLEPRANINPRLAPLTYPPVPKPIRVSRIGGTAPRGGQDHHAFRGASAESSTPATGPANRRPPVILLQTERNLGFAGGNNVGIRHALAEPGVEAVWLLNNDTVVEPDALGAMYAEFRRDRATGICGSTLLYYDSPDTVQALGGATYNRWTGLPRHMGTGRRLAEALAHSDRSLEMAYVVGASMLVSREFIEDVGLMDESLFLYFEELEWVLRAGGRYRLAHAAGARVYHKEGRSTHARARGEKSETAEWFFHRNRLRISRRYYPAASVVVRAMMLVSAGRRVARGRFRRGWRLMRLAMGNAGDEGFPHSRV